MNLKLIAIQYCHAKEIIWLNTADLEWLILVNMEKIPSDIEMIVY